MAIKGVLEEELKNSLRLKKSYEQALAKLPKGSLVKKKIKGHYRNQGTVLTLKNSLKSIIY